VLAPHQWPEAVDRRHRYGGFLKHYWSVWVRSDTRDDFFSWLDNGEGMHLDHPEAPRDKLEGSHVIYCSPEDRRRYAVSVCAGGRLVYRQSQEMVSSAPDGMKLMFVIAPDRTLYVGVKMAGRLQHSSFLAGSAVVGAGYIEVAETGTLKRITPHSGHYRPSPEDFRRTLAVLSDLGAFRDGVIVDTVKPLKKEGTVFLNDRGVLCPVELAKRRSADTVDAHQDRSHHCSKTSRFVLGRQRGDGGGFATTPGFEATPDDVETRTRARQERVAAALAWGPMQPGAARKALSFAPSATPAVLRAKVKRRTVVRRPSQGADRGFR